MHAIIRTDGTYSQSRFMQVALTVGYGCFAATGLLFLLSPKLDDWFGYSGAIMALFISLGGIASMFGTIWRRWVGEFIGAPLLGTGLSVLGIEGWVVLRDDFPYFGAGMTVLMIGTAFLVLARWRRVVATYEFVHALAQAEKREGT